MKVWIAWAAVLALTCVSLFLFLSALAWTQGALAGGRIGAPAASLGAVAADALAAWLVWRRMGGPRRQALGLGLAAAALAGATVALQPMEPGFAEASAYATVVWLFTAFALAAIAAFEAVGLVRRRGASGQSQHGSAAWGLARRRAGGPMGRPADRARHA